MKYIRTKDGIYKVLGKVGVKGNIVYAIVDSSGNKYTGNEKAVIATANTIEELEVE